MVAAAGVDTWSPCWRIDLESDVGRVLDLEAVRPTTRGSLLPEPVAGYRVVWFRSAGLLAAEGHPAGAGQLAAPDRLPDALAALTRALEDRLEVELPGPKRFDHSRHGFEGVRRLDAAVNVTSSSAQGLALLSGVAAVRPRGGLASRVRRQPGGRAIETVDWLTRRGIVARAYDKGVESNLAGRGELVRLEVQQRWPSGHRRDVEELTGGYVGRLFGRRFQPVWQASEGVTVLAMSDLAERLAQLVHDDVITPAQAEQLFAHLGFEAAGVSVGSRHTNWRRRKLAESVGLVVADGVVDACELDLSEAFVALLDEQLWGAAVAPFDAN
jgi:hypothetical protein